jgi:drug/metabolite transporter (DMT)-like permease
MSVLTLALVLTQVFSLAVGQILWKLGIDQAGGFMTSDRSMVASLLELAKSPAFVLGCVFYVVATLVWFYLLARHDLGYIYPILSLTYVVTFIGGWLILGEPLSLQRLAAVGVISLGVAWLTAT